jgi:hypothetical protein
LTTITAKNAITKDVDTDVEENKVKKMGAKELAKVPAVKKPVKNIGVKTATRTSERLKKTVAKGKDSSMSAVKKKTLRRR